ncbi:hypothetical protein CGMCC3_g16827 [Colletotrichum fructicola]|uniref:Uncharacterized protein n=1 Tax=Colletotrichum fructicola (strain Nara gc5) TaxID=1213859 RepID=L2FKQ9_COLFN|nr:uncharacterized protein CGMCC3_g16827 [Colletotrichum fructicola]KAE9567030.1 hypothetical protein CGMCC3_g16827 [Colletotrichum fructicola]KAF5496413.1 hypothetical protein CGCF413_v007919 [Colletotrichum fructicola]
MEEGDKECLLFIAWIAAAIIIFTSIIVATVQLYEDMSKPKPRFPRNPLRRLFCWLFIASTFEPSMIIYYALFLALFFIAANVAFLVTVVGLPIFCVLRAILEPSLGHQPFAILDIPSNDGSTKDERTGNMIIPGPCDWPAVCTEQAVSFSIWISGGFLEGTRSTDEEEALLDVKEDTADSPSSLLV